MDTAQSGLGWLLMVAGVLAVLVGVLRAVARDSGGPWGDLLLVTGGGVAAVLGRLAV